MLTYTQDVDWAALVSKKVAPPRKPKDTDTAKRLADINKKYAQDKLPQMSREELYECDMVFKNLCAPGARLPACRPACICMNPQHCLLSLSRNPRHGLLGAGVSCISLLHALRPRHEQMSHRVRYATVHALIWACACI